MALSHLLLRRLNYSKPLSIRLLSQVPKSVYFSSLSSAPGSAPGSSPAPKPTSLSARMNFLFEQIDEIDKNREEKDQTLQRIRTWRESKKQKDSPSPEPAPDPSAGELKSELVRSEASLGNSDVKKEVEFVHPWPEWIELMDRLVQQNYFDHRRKDEDRMMEGLGFDLSEANKEESREVDFARDFKTVLDAMVNFGRDRFDILRSLSRKDLQIMVGYGCASADKKVVYSSKLLRKLVHLDEGDVCSSCSLRGSCEKAYLLTIKEDEARTIDVMRILLAYGFDPFKGSVTNKPLMKIKSVKTVVRKLIHEVVKLSAVPIDPNLPPPVIRRPPPKVKQPPPPPKKRVGRNDVEMKKGDWLCTKCEFMNFAKNTVCLQCDAKRPKRQLLPGEWECPQCNFLNYRRNTVCFHCEHKRPPDTYPESQFSEKPRGPLNRTDKISPKREDVSDAWNFDFDDNESDGADVAAFEYADSQKLDEDFPINKQSFRDNYEHGEERNKKPPKGFEREFADSSPMGPGVGFNDFDEDDDDVDSYELVAQNEVPKTSRIDFSELEADSESEDVESTEGNFHARGRTKFPAARSKKQKNRKANSHSEDGEVSFDTDDDLPIHPDWKSSHVADGKQQKSRGDMMFGSDDDSEFSSGSDDEMVRLKNKGNGRSSMGRGRGGRPTFNASFSERDSDDEPIRSNDRGNRRGSNGTGRGRGGRSNFKSSFSEGDSDDEPIRSNDRGNRRGSNGTGRGRGGRSNFKSSFSEGDSEDEPIRSNDRGNRRGSNGSGRGREGRSNFKSSFSEGDSDDEMIRSNDRGNRRGSSGMGRGRRGRSTSNALFSESDDEPRRSNNRGNRTGTIGMGRGRGGRSTFKASFSDRDSDDDLSYQSDRQRGRGGRSGPGRGSRARGGMASDRRSSRNSDFDRSSGRKSFNSGGHRQGESFGKRGGRSNNSDNRSDSYEADERHMRPRNNVR